MVKRLLLSLGGCLLAPLLLVGCNGGEDFSDADIGGQVIQPTPGGGGPLGDDVEAVRVEFIDDRVENLGYECQGDSGSGYIGRRQIQEGGEPKQVDYPEDDETAHLPLVAECGIDSTRVDFFIGDLAQQDRRIQLGQVHLPQHIQQPRLQVSPADIVQSPARVLAQVEDDQGSPMPLVNRQAFYVAALLQALDNESDNSIIQVPDAAHALVLNCCGAEEDEPAPENLWDYDGYSAFKNEWQPWLDAVDDLGGTSSSFPTTQQDVSDALYAPENETPSYASIDRMRAGSFQFVSAIYTRKFIEDGEGAAAVPPMVLQLPVLVHPDGRVQGMGFVADVSNNEDDEAELSTSTLIAVDEGARLDRRMQMTSDQGEGWSVSHLFTEESDPEVDLNLSGRILGITLYYALDGPPSSPDSSDFDRDYSRDNVYVPDTATEGGRYDGTAFGGKNFDNELLQGSRQGIVGVDIDKTFGPGGTGLHFYELTPWKACRDSDSDGCVDFPGEESAADNYSESAEIEETTFTVSTEKQKPSIQDDHPDGVGNPRESFNVEIREDGYIVTDLDEDSCPTTYDKTEDAYYEQTGNLQDHREYRVGFVTRTHSDDNPQSVNITVHMTGPAHLRDNLPHYGLRTNGRIDLSNGELYRTGDVNFGDGIRARWLDQASGSGYAYRLYERSVGSDLTPEQKFERLTRLQGALEGARVNDSSNCP